MTTIISIMIGSSAGVFMYLFVQTMEQEALRARWFATLQRVGQEGPLLAWNRTLIPLLTRPYKKSLFKNVVLFLDRTLKPAGLSDVLNPFEFLSWSTWLLVEATLLFILFFGFSSGSIFFGTTVGLAYPWIWVSMKKDQRINNIKRDLPLIMDLLAISVMAGSDMMQALQRIVKSLPRTELLKEFEQILQDLRLGRTRKEALLAFKERVPLLEIRSFVALLVQAVQLGSPLAPVLLACADQMRTQRFLQAERIGIQASQKILFPLVFCIMPSVFLTIFAPLLIHWFTGGFGTLL